MTFEERLKQWASEMVFLNIQQAAQIDNLLAQLKAVERPKESLEGSSDATQ